MRLLFRAGNHAQARSCVVAIACHVSSFTSVSDAICDTISDIAITKLPRSAQPFASPVETTALSHSVQFIFQLFVCFYL